MSRAAVLVLLFTFMSDCTQVASAQELAAPYISTASGPLRAYSGFPFSAVQETETIRNLLDGTKIVTKGENRIWRDSQGRIRTEQFQPVPEGIPSQLLKIEILDPPAGRRYLLNPPTRVAYIERFTPVHPEPAPHLGPDNKVPAPAPGAPSAAVDPMRPSSSSEPLGTRVVAGVWAEGVRVKSTIPAGARGNDRPIVSETERWSSSELGMVVEEIRNDPRVGQSVVRLSGLDPSEPDYSLFQLPEDYVIQENATR